MDRETAAKAFTEFDQDGSGKVDKKELRNVVKAFHELMGETADEAKIDADVKSILEIVDTSGDGKVDKEEFIKYFTS